MKKIILYGAFDRYNFGDNLMPIVFELFFEKYYSESACDVEFIYSSVSDSDLTKYSCLKTENINDVIKEAHAGDSIVVVGGEVMCADAFTLFTHMPKPKAINDILKSLNKVRYINRILKSTCNYFYHAPWSYPYIPDNLQLNDGVKIIYNTVGGGIEGLNNRNRKDIISRLRNAEFISVRDNRTFENLKFDIPNTVVSPDSVYLISDLISDEDLNKKVRSDFLEKFISGYIVFQAAPTKVGQEIEVIRNALCKLSIESNRKIILLPIGYALGHDDTYYLKQLFDLMPDFSEFLDELTVWEILYIIRNSDAYIGTSLHGAITAMSYGIPHFGLNENISKLDSFLKDWTVAPFNKCYPIDSIVDAFLNLDEEKYDELDVVRRRNFKLINENFNQIFELIL